MKINDWLQQATQALSKAGIATARLDALVLLEDQTGKDRAWLLAHDEFEIDQANERKLKKLLNQRATHLPLAYVRGQTEFYGRTFVITPAVLEPRPESEAMIDLLKGLFQEGKLVGSKEKMVHVADVGTGSGALGITGALEVPHMAVELLEIDKNAAEIAKINVDKFTLNISVILSDLLTSATHDYQILLCNLPYVTDGYQINSAAAHEPRIALFGGPDGLDVYRKLFIQVNNLPNKPLYILTESLPSQHEPLAALAAAAGYSLQTSDDFIQLFAAT